MFKHVREKCEKLCISSILSSKRGITPTEINAIDDTGTLSVVQKSKVICKISAQYVKACKRKVQNTEYFQYSKFQKGHNSHQKMTQIDGTGT